MGKINPLDRISLAQAGNIDSPNFTYKLSVLNYEPQEINAIDSDKYIVHE